MSACKPLTREQYAKVRGAFRGRWRLRDLALFETGISCGFRISELLTLQLQDVCSSGQIGEEVTIDRQNLKGGKTKAGLAKADTIESTVWLWGDMLAVELAAEDVERRAVRRQVDRLAKALIGRKVSNVRSRTMPLSPAARAALADLLGLMDSRGLQHPATPLFATLSGRALTRYQSYRILKDAYARAGLPRTGYGTHTLRKTFAQWLMEELERQATAGDAVGNTLQLLQQALGHCRIDSTVKYIEPTKSALSSALARVHDSETVPKKAPPVDEMAQFPECIELAALAGRLGLSTRRLRREAEAGRLTARKVAGRWITTAAAAETYLAACQQINPKKEA